VTEARDIDMRPDPTLRPPAGAGIPHPRAFGIALHTGDRGLSRTVEHVSNTEYVRWIDRAAELHADALGHSRAAMAELGHMWFVARHEIDYRAEAFPGEELHVFTWVRSIAGPVSWRDTVVLRPGDGRLVCAAATRWAWVNLASRRPVRVPHAIAEALDPMERR